MASPPPTPRATPRAAGEALASRASAAGGRRTEVPPGRFGGGDFLGGPIEKPYRFFQYSAGWWMDNGWLMDGTVYLFYNIWLVVTGTMEF